MKTKRILVETNNGPRYFRVPADELNNAQIIRDNQRGPAGVYVTDTYYSKKGIVIERCYSCRDTGRGSCVGTYYQLVEDPFVLRKGMN